MFGRSGRASIRRRFDALRRVGAAGSGDPAAPVPAGGLARLFSRPDLRRLLAGQTVSGLGDWMATVALLALVHERTGSSTAVGGVLVLRLAPTVFAGPLAAKLVDRFDARQTMLAADAFRAIVVTLLPLWDSIAWIYVAAFLLELGGLVFLPARDAAVPKLTEGHDLELANGLVLGTSYATIPFGAGAFAAVAAVTGDLAPVFWIDAVTFGVSFAAIARITSLGGRPRRTDAEEGSPSFRAAWRVPLVRAVVPVAVGVALGLGALFSVGVVYVREVLHASNATFAGLVALFGVGAAAGLALLHTTGGASAARVRWLVAAQGFVIAAMSQAPGVALALVGAVLFGGAAAAGLAAAMSLLQSRLADRELFLAFTAFHVVIRAGLAVAALAAGVAADLVEAVEWPLVGQLEGARVVLLGAGLTVAASTLSSHALAGLAGDERNP